MMDNSLTKGILRESKKLPIVIGWGDACIHIGELEFLKNGSLVFESRFHNDRNVGSLIEFGQSSLKSGKFYNQITDRVADINTGFHVTLHAVEENNPSVMHFREHYPGEILFRREIDWFPVKKAFNLLRLFTLPVDLCSTSHKQVTIERVIDPKYTDSLEIVVDIFPLDTKTVHSYPNCIEVWGYCPDYRTRLSIVLAKQRTPALIYWPEDDELSL